MAFNTQGAAMGAAGGAAMGAPLGPVGMGVGAVAGGLAGGFTGSEAEAPEPIFRQGTGAMTKALYGRIQQMMKTGGYSAQDMTQLRAQITRALQKQRAASMQALQRHLARRGMGNSGLVYRSMQEMGRKQTAQTEEGMRNLLGARIAGRAQSLGYALKYTEPLGSTGGSMGSPGLGPVIGDTGPGVAQGYLAGQQSRAGAYDSQEMSGERARQQTRVNAR